MSDKIYLNRNIKKWKIDWEQFVISFCTEVTHTLITGGIRGNIFKSVFDSVEESRECKAFDLILVVAIETVRSLISNNHEHLKINKDKFKRLIEDFIKKKFKPFITQNQLYLEATFFSQDASQNAIVKSIKDSLLDWLLNAANCSDEVTYQVVNSFEIEFTKSLNRLLQDDKNMKTIYEDLKNFFEVNEKSGYDKLLKFHEKQSFYAKKYLANIFEDSEVEVPLSEIYISPRCQKTNDLQNSEAVDDVISKFLKETNRLKETYKNICLIYGNAGQGKSALCKKLLFFRNNFSTQHFYYIKGSSLKFKDILKVPKTAIINWIAKEENYKFPPFPNSIWIIDGLDEIDRGTSQESIEPAIAELASTIKNTGIKVIITARKGFFELSSDDIVNCKRITSFELLPLNFQEQQRLVEQYKNFALKINHNIQPISSDLKHLYKIESEQNRALYDLFGNPIFLSLVLDQKMGVPSSGNIEGRSEGELSYNTVIFLDAFFSDLFSLLVKKENNNNKRKDEDWHRAFRHIEKNDWLRFLRGIAFKIHTSRELYIELEKFKSFLKNEDNSISIEAHKVNKIAKILLSKIDKCLIQNNEIDVDPIIKLLQIGGYLKVENGANGTKYIAFEHDLLREYLAAKEIWERIISYFKIPKNQRSNLLEVLQELFGQNHFSKETWEYIRAIIKLEERDIDHLKSSLKDSFSNILRHQGLYTYAANDSKYHVPPVNQAVASFFAYWTIITSILDNASFVEKQDQDALRQCISYLVGFVKGFRINLKGIDWKNLKEIAGENLSNLDLSNAKLQGTTFRGCDMRNLILNDAELDNSTNFKFCNLSGLKVKNSNKAIENASFVNCNMSNSDFSSSILQGVEFKYCVLPHSKFNNSKFNNVKIKDCFLPSSIFAEDFEIKEESDFTNSKLDNSIFQNGKIVNTIFTNSVLKNSQFENVKLIEIDFTEADLRKTNLTENHVNKWTSLEEARLNPNLEDFIRGNNEFSDLVIEDEDNYSFVDEFQNEFDEELEQKIEDKVEEILQKKLKENPIWQEYELKMNARRKKFLIIYNETNWENRIEFSDWLEKKGFPNSESILSKNFIEEIKEKDAQEIIANRTFELILFNNERGDLKEENMNKIAEKFNTAIPFFYYNITNIKFNSSGIRNILYANSKMTLITNLSLILEQNI